jgi:hypothetical protein
MYIFIKTDPRRGARDMEAEAQCPYCGELITIWVDLGGGGAQRYVEDCSVCCRPIEVAAYADEEGEFSVDLRRLDE